MHMNAIDITTPRVLVLPRPTREVVARLADRMATRGHGMSKHAAAAVELLLSDCDRVELSYLQATTVRLECEAQTRRNEAARAKRPLQAREQAAEQAALFVLAQLRTAIV